MKSHENINCERSQINNIFTLNIGTPYLFTMLVLEFVHCYYLLICLKPVGCLANSVDPDQMLHAASDLGLLCLLRSA